MSQREAEPEGNGTTIELTSENYTQLDLINSEAEAVDWSV